MSWEALAWAARQRVTRAADKLILIGLADRHNSEENAAWPSLAWLGEFSSLDRKTIIAALDRLQQAGLIADTGVRKGRTGQVKAYSLNLNSAEITIPKTEPLNSAVFPGKGCRKRNPEPIREPLASSATQIKHTRTQTQVRTAVAVPDWVPEEAWAGFVEMRKRIRKPMTERAQQLMLKKLAALKDEGNDPAEVLDRSTMNNWQGIFSVKGDSNGHASNRSRNGSPSATDIALARVAELEARQSESVGASWQSGVLQLEEHPD